MIVATGMLIRLSVVCGLNDDIDNGGADKAVSGVLGFSKR